MKRVFWFAMMAPIALAVNAQDYFNRRQVLNAEFNFGLTQPDTSSDIFNLLEETTTLNSDDLDGGSFNFKLQYQMNNFLSLGGMVATYSEDTTVVDNFYEDEDGFPIAQDIDFETTFIGFSVIWTPFGAGETFGTRGWAPKRFVPYLCFGLGFKSWEFLNAGDFVDDSDPNNAIIYSDEFFDDGTVAAARFGGGFRINLTKKIDINCLYEHDYAEDNLGGGFDGFGDLDLSSKSAYLGVILRL